MDTKIISSVRGKNMLVIENDKFSYEFGPKNVYLSVVILNNKLFFHIHAFTCFNFPVSDTEIFM
jgi:hypothetical protein